MPKDSHFRNMRTVYRTWMLGLCLVVLASHAECSVQVHRGKFYGATLGLGVGSSKPAKRPYFEFFATECAFDQDEEPHRKCYGSKLHIYYHFKDRYKERSRITFKPKNFKRNKKGPRYFRPTISADHAFLEKYLALTTYPDKEKGWDRSVTWFIRPIDQKWDRPTIKKVEAPQNASSWYGHSLSVFPGDPDNGGVLVADKGRAFVQYYNNKLNKVKKADVVSPLPDIPTIIDEFATSVTQPFSFLPLVSQVGVDGSGNIFTLEKKTIGYSVSYSVKEFMSGPWYDEKFGEKMVGKWRNLIVSGTRYSGRDILYVYRQIENTSYEPARWKFKHKIDPLGEKGLRMKMRNPPVFDVSQEYIAIAGYRGEKFTKSYREMVALYKLKRYSNGDVRFIYQGKTKDPRYKDSLKSGLCKLSSNEFGYSLAVSDSGDVFVGSPRAYSRLKNGKIESKGSVDLFLSNEFKK